MQHSTVWSACICDVLKQRHMYYTYIRHVQYTANGGGGGGGGGMTTEVEFVAATCSQSS